MRETLKNAANSLLGALGLRMVSSRWGPRGPMDTLRRIRSYGLIPKQIVDIGASNGTWTRECLQIYPESRYFLIDPLPENLPALAQLESTHRNVRVWNGAVGAQAGLVEMHAHGDQSSFLPSDVFNSDRKRLVEVRTLDSFLSSGDLHAPQFIKADVQGFELAVLQGAAECLKTTQLLLLEVSFRRIYRDAPLAHEVIAAVGRQGFRIFDICTYFARPSDSELVQSDILFAADSSMLFQNEGV